MGKTMGQVGRRTFAMLLATALVLFFVGAAGTASAEKKLKSKRSQGKLVSLDQKAGTMTIKEKGKDTTYHVMFEGSVLTRTTATMNAKPVKLEEIPINAPVIVYWKPDEKDRHIRRARKVDAPKVPEELMEEFEK